MIVFYLYEYAEYGKNILSTASTKLNWSHFCGIMCIEADEG